MEGALGCNEFEQVMREQVILRAWNEIVQVAEGYHSSLREIHLAVSQCEEKGKYFTLAG